METALMREVLIRLSQLGAKAFRNNQGVATYPNNVKVKYGVGGPGGSDIIGFMPVIITADMVGHQVAVFLAAEVKTETGRVSPSQQHFVDVVRESGGLAGIVRSCDEIPALLIWNVTQT